MTLDRATSTHAYKDDQVSTERAGASRTRALVLFGGTGPERAGSLVSGKAASQSLRRMGWQVDLVDVNSANLSAIHGDFDVALVATHGWYGEDGKLQGWLEMRDIPYTGSGVLASAAAMHKPTANRIFTHAGLDVPEWISFFPQYRDDEAIMRWADGRYPLFCKPTSGGGSLGACRVDHVDQLADLLGGLTSHAGGPELMLSPFIDGVELSVAVRATSTGQSCLPILETSFEADFYDYDVKHQEELRHHDCPARLDEAVVRRIERAAMAACSSLGCYGYARADFRLASDGTPWLLEVNTVPGLAQHGNLATMAAAGGMSYDELMSDCVSLALTKPARYRP